MTSKRIAIAYDCLFPFTKGGGERQYRDFAEELVRRGYEVDYLTARQWDDAPDASFAIVPVTGRLGLYDADGVRSMAAALRFAGGLWWSLARRRRSLDAVIVSGLPVLNVLAARVALVGSRAPLAVDYLEVWDRRQWIAYAGRVIGTAAWAAQRAAVAVTPLAMCHSRLTAERLGSEGLCGAPVVSPGLVAGAREAHFNPVCLEPPYVLYAGRHIPDKRVETLPAAVAHARRVVPNLRLVVLGDGPTAGAVREAVETIGSPEWIEMLGFVSTERLEELMEGAACLVNPSRREGYGLVVVEAAAHGTPVVLVEHPGNASVELVERDVNGVVAPADDAASLGGAIVEVVLAGGPLRASTRAWYEDALETRTVARTVEGILDAMGFDR
ncbi:glycosyltransferase family 4 protein [Demequina salsinemoris]|uniref:glycosyltransferase family 4 protein n=1 Tax=Demequina salsinemoris TaxID=577470 RepID=UPI0007819294|nr:glycosyltransferase family 4 protein [Demequina salsinemoris]